MYRMNFQHDAWQYIYFAAIDWSHPWIVGIGAALISGLLVNLISKKFGLNSDKHYREKIDTANNEVIYALRPSIAEGAMPSQQIIESLTKATARKYALKPENLMSPDDFADSLIKEVMDSNFLSHEKKIEYCTEVLKLKTPQPVSTTTTTTTTIAKAEISEKDNVRFGSSDPYYVYRQKLLTQMTVILSVTAAIITLESTVFTLEEKSSESLDNPIYFLVIMIIPLFAVYAVAVASKTRRRITDIPKIQLPTKNAQSKGKDRAKTSKVSSVAK
jgi:hypothetical protein